MWGKWKWEGWMVCHAHKSAKLRKIWEKCDQIKDQKYANIKKRKEKRYDQIKDRVKLENIFSHRVTANWRRFKNVVNPALRPFQLWLQEWAIINAGQFGVCWAWKNIAKGKELIEEWPVYSEVVSPQNDLWESFVVEEHVDGRGVRHLDTFICTSW